MQVVFNVEKSIPFTSHRTPKVFRSLIKLDIKLSLQKCGIISCPNAVILEKQSTDHFFDFVCVFSSTFVCRLLNYPQLAGIVDHLCSVKCGLLICSPQSCVCFPLVFGKMKVWRVFSPKEE